ncbi:hypothetical protein GCM10022221_68650 [Actinocorallia aurea]
MADWQFNFYDRGTGELMDTLPVSKCGFSQKLNGSGNLSGQIPLDADGVDPRRVLDATIPWRSMVAVQRNQAQAWCGIIREPRDRSSSSRFLSFKAVEPLELLASRFLPSTPEGGLTLPIRELAAFLLELFQTPDDDLWMRVAEIDADSPPANVTWNKWDFTAAARVLTELTERTSGIEFMQRPGRRADGRPEVLLHTGHPRIGRGQHPGSPVLEYNRTAPEASNVVDYTWSEGAGFAVRTWATSQAEGGAVLAAQAEHAYLLDAGFPLVEQHLTFDGVADTAELQARADASAAASVGPLITSSFTVLAQKGLELGDIAVGDDFRARITDRGFPPQANGDPGWDGWLRATGIEVSVDADAGVEKYNLTMADIIGRW